MSAKDPQGLTASETAAVKTELSEGIEDEFEDAVENEEASFKVTIEELKILRAELACEFPDDYNYLSDAYVLSVASKPYSKDPTVRRPLEYSMEKLTHVMQWRQEAGAPDMEDMLALANGPDSAKEAVQNPEKFTKAKALATALNYGSMYWHGVDNQGRPVMWIRTNRMPWYPDVEAQVNALILLADAGIRCMPHNVTEFVVFSDSYSPPPPNPQFMINLLKALVRGYPDRLHLLVSAPVGSIIQFVVKLLLPLMPGRLASKVCLENAEDGKKKMAEMLYNGADDVPTFMGGKLDHDKLYPTEGYCPNRGKGCLKFDYYGMCDRLEKTVKDWEADQP